MMRTADTWPRIVKNYEEVPVAFRDFFSLTFPKQISFPYTVFAPPDRWGRRRTNPKLICVTDNRIYVAEKLKKEIGITYYDFEKIDLLELGSILLYSWFKITGINNSGSSVITVEFNTVVEEYFSRIVNIFRARVTGLEQTDFQKEQLKKEQRKFDHLSTVNFKYMNFARRSILAGEKVVGFVLQPDYRVRFLKYFHRTLTYTHMTILTDRELIVIKDDDSFKKVNIIRYGGIWSYIPFQRITHLTLTETLQKNDHYLTLEISLLHGEVIRSLFSPDHRLELDSLINEYDRFKNVPVKNISSLEVNR